MSATIVAGPRIPSTVADVVRLFLHRFDGDVRRAYASAERALLAADPDDVERWALVCSALAGKAVTR